MAIKNLLTKKVAMGFVLITLGIQTFCAALFLSANKDIWPWGYILELFQFIVLVVAFTRLFSKCPVCGKRTLSMRERCSGSRHILFDGECRACGNKFDISVNTRVHMTSVFIVDKETGLKEPI